MRELRRSVSHNPSRKKAVHCVRDKKIFVTENYNAVKERLDKKLKLLKNFKLKTSTLFLRLLKLTQD